jgi:peptide deformylase
VPVLPIVVTGHPALHRPAAPVVDSTPEIAQLVTDMTDTMNAAPGVGLAAPQVGVSLQVFVWHFDDGSQVHAGHVLNPRLAVSGWPRHLLFGEPDEEGCLSLPGLRSPLARYPRARLQGIDLYGQPVDVLAEGWLARIFQHEYDHVRGVLYSDRLSNRRRRDILADAQSAGLGITLTSWTPGVDGEESDFVTEHNPHEP